MFTGIQSYGTYYGNRPYRREMGETPEDMAKAVKWQEEQEAKSKGDFYRPREMGETPEDVARTGKPDNNYASNPERTYEHRPREMGETPEDVAKADAEAEANRPKKYSEMTEQERIIDLYA